MSESAKSKKSKSARLTRRNSGSNNSAVAEERMYAKMAKKLGLKALTEDHKRYIYNAANSASVSGSVDEKALLRGLKGIKEHVAELKTAGKNAHEAGLAKRTRRADRLKARYEEAKEGVATDLRRLARSTGKKVAAKGSLHLAKLRAHGFNLAVADHVHLTKHLEDKTTERIKERLRHESRKSSPCDKCAVEDYLVIV